MFLVLGALYVTESTQSSKDANDYNKTGVYYFNSDCQNLPTQGVYLVYIIAHPGGRVIQYAWHDMDISIYIRNKIDGAWGAWKEFSLNMPSFYKNYADLAALKSAIDAISYPKFETTSLTSPSTQYKSSIKASMGEAGNTILVLASTNSSVGDSTISGIYLIRCSYSGNTVASEQISKLHGNGTDADLLVSVSEDGYITLTGYKRYILMSIK